MKKDKYLLVCSTGSLEQLLEKTIMYFCGSSIVFRKIDEDNWYVYNAKGRILSARAVKKGTRYRLEVH